jgi:amidohydrolase
MRYSAAMNPNDLRRLIAGLQGDLVAVRRDLHRHPELGFEEVRTQGVVRTWLENHGYRPRVVAETGLVADLEPGSGGPTIALRADMDALPMDEATDLPYRSINPGRAHKCGHDGHTAILMGVAAVLATLRGAFDGNVRLIFQPAEEGVRGGGARVMVAEGVLDGVSEVFGLHSWPDWPRGELRVAAGPVMARVHLFDITVTGCGGHGSQPEHCRDPIVAAAHLVTAMQTAVSRDVGIGGGAVVSVCSFESGTTNNVIPDEARLSGTIRTFDAAVAERVVDRLREIARGVARAFGVDIELAVEDTYPVLANHPECAAAVARVGERVLGTGSASARDLPMAASEDFAFFAERCPAAFFFLGAGRPGERTPGCHHPDFDFDDELIPVAIELFMGLVADRLGTPS